MTLRLAFINKNFFRTVKKNDKITNEKSHEYLEIIDGETDRLA
ncbi:MAG: hypothetical protein R3A12_06435 [Ignavibacteria bacterium]